MIHFALRTDEAGRLTALEVDGHSGLSAKGEDVLCAAVSAIVETLAGAVTEILKRGIAERRDGWIRIGIDRPDSDSELLCGAALLSIRRLQSDHPERIRIEIIHDRGQQVTEHRRGIDGT